MDEKGITSIMFLPVCKKCLNIIWQEVDCEQRPAIYSGKPRLRLVADYDIRPERCPHCNSWITSIEMPTKLPFDGTKYFSLQKE